jgi:group I intron endonuclease
MSTGIYKIQCTKTNASYIGMSRNISQRWGAHRKLLRDGLHTVRRFQADWVEHGESAFKFSILEECSSDELVTAEARHITEHIGNLYNSNLRGRPRTLTDAQRRSKVVMVRLTVSEYEAIQRIATRWGVSLSQFMRLVAVEAAKK